MKLRLQQCLPAVLMATFLVIFIQSDHSIALDEVPVAPLATPPATQAAEATKPHGKSDEHPAEGGKKTKVKDNRAAISRLSPLSNLVGKWRGVGQPQRGSNNGAWTETTSCQWKFDEQDVSLVLKSESGKQFRELHFAPGDEPPSVRMSMLLPDEMKREFQYQPDQSSESMLVFISSPESLPQHRCTVRKISDIRMTMLLEQKSTATGSFRRAAEIGYTREGERLAVANAGERQCIVTGGLGTIRVTFEGQTYYVCCEGCRQAFDADPKGTIQAYKDSITK